MRIEAPQRSFPDAGAVDRQITSTDGAEAISPEAELADLELGQLASFRDGEALLTRTMGTDGRVSTTIYVSRAGYALPRVEHQG